jgi:microcystin-dependent protein
MAAPFVAEIRPWACNFAPIGWAFCQGQTLAISQNTALFSLIGTYYGGNGTTTFQLPNLMGRVPLKFGTDSTGNTYFIGEQAGVEQVTIQSTTMPIHTHIFSGTNQVGGRQHPANGSAFGTSSGGNLFYGASNASTTNINVGTISPYNGGNLAHENRQPYQVLNWCIALRGIFPSRN